MAVNHQRIVLGQVGLRFLAGHRAGELALRRIVLQQVREIVGGNDVIDSNHIQRLAEQTLFDQRAEDQAPDPAKPVDANFHRHDRLLGSNSAMGQWP